MENQQELLRFYSIIESGIVFHTHTQLSVFSKDLTISPYIQMLLKGPHNITVHTNDVHRLMAKRPELNVRRFS